MRKYKIFVNRIKHGEEIIVSKDITGLNKEEYYEFIKDESHIKNSQLIVSDYIMKDILLDYVLNRKYILVSVRTSNEEENILLEEYCSKMQDERAYFSLINEIAFKDYSTIESLTLQVFEEILTISVNGIIDTNVNIEEDLLKLILSSYRGIHIKA